MLFERFRRPRWQHTDPAVRREAVTRLSPRDPEEAGLLATLAVDDANPGVRTAAAKRLEDLGLLRRCLGEDADATVRETARARYRQLLSGGREGDDLEERLSEVRACDDNQVLAHLALSARDEAMRLAALDRITDPGVLEEAAVHDLVARVRQAAVERIDDPATLERLAQRARRSDPRLARLARRRLEQHHERVQQERDTEREAEAICHEIEQLLSRADLPETAEAQRQRLANRWEAMPATPAENVAQRYRELDGRLGERLAREASPESGTAEGPAPEGGPTLDDILAQLTAGREPDEEWLESLERALESVKVPDDRTKWLRAAVRSFLGARESLESAMDAPHRERLESLLDQVDWPEDGPPAPSLIRRAEAWLNDNAEPSAPSATDRPVSAPGDDAREAGLKTVRERLDVLERILEQGRLRPARRELQQVRAAVKTVEGAVPRRLERRVARASARVAELRDWRRFAVLPKQESLCEAMESLADDTELTPPERAARIKDLQRQWKSTGGSDSPRSRELWSRFRQAAEKAFEPCREWFDREEERRRANLEARGRIAEQLAEFTAGADIAAMPAANLDRIRRKAREEWNQTGPVDRKAAKPVSDRFESLMDELTAVIEEKRAVAGAAKQDIVERAQALESLEDPESAAEQAKRLQTEWKAAGQAKPSGDRALWKAFRASCDRIFERRDEGRAAARNRQDAVVADAEALCEAMETLSGDNGSTAVEDVRGEAEELRRRFRRLNLPESRVGQGVAGRFERAQRSVNARIRELEARASLAELEELRAAAEACARLESGETPPAEPEALLPPDAPEWLTAPLRERAGRARNGGAAPDPQARRDICIRLEILAGEESPAEDEERRMALQVERLAEGMGGGERLAPEEVARRLAARWYGIPGSDESLGERFDSALRGLVERGRD